MPGWLALMIDRNELDLDGRDGQMFRTKAVETRAELLQLLEDGLKRSRASLQNTTEEHLMTPWRLVMGGRALNEGTPVHEDCQRRLEPYGSPPRTVDGAPAAQ